ncbi:MAG: META domain-containing protein [Bacteroidota bacterium]
MKNMCVMLLAVLMMPFLAAAKQRTILINSEQQDCIGIDNNRTKCLEFKEKGKDKTWQFLYQPIRGFKFEPGYLYTLLINETIPVKQSDTASTSNIQWTLVKLVKKERVPAMEYGELIGSKKGIGGDWRFVKMMGPDPMDFTSKKERISFNDSSFKVSGKASCNSFFGNYTVTGFELNLGALGSTMMACPEMEKERIMMKALETVNMWEVKGNKLLLKNADTVVFELERIVVKTI